MTAVVHDFRESLRASHEQANAPFWLAAYRRAFPTLQAAVCVREDGWAQRGGVDRLLTLACGRVVRIDEKVRLKDYGDILLERWSNYEKGVPGWIVVPLLCDYIAYAVLPLRTCYLLPTLELQRAWRECGPDWARRAKAGDSGFRIVRAKNDRYETISIAVPKEVVFSAIRDSMVVSWTEAEAA